MSINTTSKSCFSTASTAKPAVRDDSHVVASFFQQPNRKRLIHGMVFSQQDSQPPPIFMNAVSRQQRHRRLGCPAQDGTNSTQ